MKAKIVFTVMFPISTAYKDVNSMNYTLNMSAWIWEGYKNVFAEVTLISWLCW